MNRGNKNWRYFSYAVLATVCLIGAVSAADAEERSASQVENWRPKNGTYTESLTDPDQKGCEEVYDIDIELPDKEINGYEWGCRVRKLTNIARDSIRVDTTCYEPEQKSYKWFFTFKRIDENTILLGGLGNGKSTPEKKMSYCPENFQQINRDARAKSAADAKLKAAQEREKPAVKN